MSDDLKPEKERKYLKRKRKTPANTNLNRRGRKRETDDLIGEKVFVPFGADQIIVEITDPEVQTSGRDLEVVVTQPLLRGLDVPKEKMPERNTIDYERWLAIVETLIQKGLNSIIKIKQTTGLSYKTSANMVQEVRQRWAKSLTLGQVNSRREQIYKEAERVKDECWRRMEFIENDTMRLRMMQMILECGKRMSSLIGAERINVNVESGGAGHKTIEDMQSEVVGISVEQFQQIGQALSQQLTDTRKDGEDA